MKLFKLRSEKRTQASVDAPISQRNGSKMRAITRIIGLSVLVIGSGIAMVLNWPTVSKELPVKYSAQSFTHSLEKLKAQSDDLLSKQIQAQVELVSAKYLQENLSNIETEIHQTRYDQAKTNITSLKLAIDRWNYQLSIIHKDDIKGTPAPPTPGQVYIPISLYHYTPANFDQQLAHLEHAGYTTVDLDQVEASLSGKGSLPAKPIVITFDDGFADQLKAFEILKAHRMKATYYIINGGPSSRWCIGADRRYNDPLQPPHGCGDAYMNWSQIRRLDQSGLITIGGHTLDHSNLPTLSLDQQRHEIQDSKLDIEKKLGHEIRHFAYPYGNFTAETIKLVQEAGYSTSVTVAPGAYQSPTQPFTLKRIRDMINLP